MFDLAPAIDPPIHPHTHTPTHRWGCLSKSQIFKQNWIILIQSTVIWPQPIHQPTHLPTHQTIHPPMDGGVSTDFKSLNRIEISRLVQVLLHFDWFWGSPRGGGGWMGVGSHERVPPTHVHTHAHAYDIIRNSQGFPQWWQPFAIEIIMFTTHACACVCMHACAWMCTCVRAPPTTPHPPTPAPEPQGAQITKIQ